MKASENKPPETRSATFSSLLEFWDNSVLTFHNATKARIVPPFLSNSVQFPSPKGFSRRVVA